MSSPRYVYIGDQGRVFRSLDAPTPEDFSYAAVGMLTIIRLADCSYYGSERKWQPVPEGELGTADIDGEETDPFHELASDAAPSLLDLNSLQGQPERAKSNSNRPLRGSNPADAQR